MIRQIFYVTLILIITGCSRPEKQLVTFNTDMGMFTVVVYPEQAPLTVANFLRYVDGGYYRDSHFYRTVTLDNQPHNTIKIEVIQGGLYGDDRHLAPIAHETTAMTGLRHTDGTISMARNEPGSATAEIFICIGVQPELDYGGRRNPDGQGFAAFGRVVSGMDVVRKIHCQPQREQLLEPWIRIIDVVRND
ncbi:MAG: peptidylprolyl isomerase [Candidatus Neomarinimicrobiota bacterium]